MDRFRRLAARRGQLIEQLAGLGPMRMGSITEQRLPFKRSDGSVRLRGPYLKYTFKRKGKTCGKHLRGPEVGEIYRRQIETYRRYQELSAELVEVSQALADLEVAGDEGGKKNSKN